MKKKSWTSTAAMITKHLLPINKDNYIMGMKKVNNCISLHRPTLFPDAVSTCETETKKSCLGRPSS
jgi:hypothetical protein